MNKPKFEHVSLGNVVKGLESIEGMSLADIKADLVSKGYDPDAFVSRIKARVNAMSKESRLSWMKVGNEAQARMDAALRGVTSWATRSVAEIDKAFDDVLKGRHGPAASMELQTAFSNVTKLTPESKAAMLDNIEALRTLSGKDGQHPKQ